MFITGRFFLSFYLVVVLQLVGLHVHGESHNESPHEEEHSNDGTVAIAVLKNVHIEQNHTEEHHEEPDSHLRRETHEEKEGEHEAENEVMTSVAFKPLESEGYSYKVKLHIASSQEHLLKTQCYNDHTGTSELKWYLHFPEAEHHDIMRREEHMEAANEEMSCMHFEYEVTESLDHHEEVAHGSEEVVHASEIEKECTPENYMHNHSSCEKGNLYGKFGFLNVNLTDLTVHAMGTDIHGPPPATMVSGVMTFHCNTTQVMCLDVVDCSSDHTLIDFFQCPVTGDEHGSHDAHGAHAHGYYLVDDDDAALVCGLIILFFFLYWFPTTFLTFWFRKSYPLNFQNPKLLFAQAVGVYVIWIIFALHFLNFSATGALFVHCLGIPFFYFCVVLRVFGLYSQHRTAGLHIRMLQENNETSQFRTIDRVLLLIRNWPLTILFVFVFLHAIVGIILYFAYDYDSLVDNDLPLAHAVTNAISGIYTFLVILSTVILLKDFQDRFRIKYQLIIIVVLILICLFFILILEHVIKSTRFPYYFMYGMVAILVHGVTHLTPLYQVYDYKRTLAKKKGRNPSQSATVHEIVKQILEKPQGKAYKKFLVHVAAEYATENLLFYEQVRKWKLLDSEDKIGTKAREIYHEFLIPDSENQINIPSTQFLAIKRKLANEDYETTLFDHAQKEVVKMLEDTYRRSSEFTYSSTSNANKSNTSMLSSDPNSSHISMRKDVDESILEKINDDEFSIAIV